MRARNQQNVVLVVDDDMFVRKIVSDAISPYARVVEVGDGNEVLKAYRANMPDLVFLDIHLPHQSGIELLGEILNFDPYAYVVMLSADSRENNTMTASGIGIKGFLTKPFQKARIISQLQNCPTIRFAD